MKFYPGFFNPKRTARETVQYLGVSQSRRLQSEYPIGDHLGGPAYGLKAMPVVAVVAAIGTFATGAAVATAAGATLGAMIAGGAMMIGASLTVVGAITGNQKLMKIGGVLSLAGGIGAGLMGAMGGLTEGAATAGTEAAASAAGDVAGSAATDAAAGAATDTAAQTALGDVGSNLTQTATENIGGGLLDDVAGEAAQVGNAVTEVANPAGSVFDAGALGNADVTGTSALSTANTATGQALQEKAGLLDRATGWMSRNKDLTKIGVDALGGIAKAVPSDKDKAELELIRARAEDQKRRNNWWSGPRKGA